MGIIHFLTYTAVYIDKNKFIERFVKVVAFFAVMSIFMWVITLIAPNIFIATSLYSYVPYSTKYWLSGETFRWIATTYYGNPFFVMRVGNELSRNNGVFNEPGLYQIVLNTALFALLYYEEKIQLNENKKNKLVAIIVIAIITCQSTTGYIGMAALFLGVLVSSNHGKKTKILGSVALIAAACSVDFIVNGSESLIMTTIGARLFASNGGFELNKSSFARVETMVIAMQSIVKKPLGVGFDNFQQMIEIAGKTSSDGAGLFAFATALGIEIIIIIFVFVILPIIKYHKSAAISIVAIFLYINTVSGQSDVFYPALLVLALPIWKDMYPEEKEYREKAINEGFMVNASENPSNRFDRRK